MESNSKKRAEFFRWMNDACIPFRNMTMEQAVDCQYDLDDFELAFKKKFQCIFDRPAPVGLFYNMLLSAIASVN